MRYMIAYDISSDDARARVAAKVSAWGDRIQKSVFECTLDQKELEELLVDIESLVNPLKDSVHVVPLCASCDGSRRLVGQAFRPEEEWCWVV